MLKANSTSETGFRIQFSSTVVLASSDHVINVSMCNSVEYYQLWVLIHLIPTIHRLPCLLTLFTVVCFKSLSVCYNKKFAYHGSVCYTAIFNVSSLLDAY